MLWPSGEKKGVPSAGEFEAIADCWRGGVKILNDSWLTVALGGVSGRCGSDDALLASVSLVARGVCIWLPHDNHLDKWDTAMLDHGPYIVSNSQHDTHVCKPILTKIHLLHMILYNNAHVSSAPSYSWSLVSNT